MNWYREESQADKKSGGSGKGRKKKGFKNYGNVQTETVMFVPNTKGGTLARKLREREEVLASVTGYGVRYQEAGGNQLANMFSTDMYRGEQCGRKACLTCPGASEDRPNCRARNLLYESSFTICNPATMKTNPSQEDEPKVREGINYVDAHEKEPGTLSGCCIFLKEITHYQPLDVWTY